MADIGGKEATVVARTLVLSDDVDFRVGSATITPFGHTRTTHQMVYYMRQRFTVAQVNAGATITSAVPGAGYRMVDCKAVAIGGNAGTVTTVDVLGTQAGSSVKLVAYAQGNLTRSTVLTAGGTGAAVLADGASWGVCDPNTAITIGKTGGATDTATHIDIYLSYVLEK